MCVRMHSFFWDWYARCYDVLMEACPYRRLLGQALDCLPAGTGLLLDAGCGTGNLLKAIRERYPSMSLHGIDFSRSMLERAAVKIPDVKLGQADLNASLPYPDGCFDVVTCINVLYAVAEPKETLEELRRVLKPGGVLIVSSPLPHPAISPIIRAHAAEAGWPSTLGLLGHIFVLVLFNLLIVRRSKTYHFLDQRAVQTLLACSSITQAYAHQNWFACVTKD